MLSRAECWARLEGARHGVLGTVHPARGVDAVPVVFAVSAGRILLPIDTVKAKRHTDLQRIRNLERDPRCVLLVDRYDEEWSRLWWVRVHGEAVALGAVELAVARPLLAARYPQYDRPGAVAAVLALTPTSIGGWAAPRGAGGP